MRLAAYLRVSTAQQTLLQQRHQINEAGHFPTHYFKDVGSGGTRTTRPGWAACMSWLQRGDKLVVAAVDRLGRSASEVTGALAELEQRGVVVSSVREGVDTSTAIGRGMVGMLASLAELELEMGRERRAASREDRIARGLPATRPPKLNADQQSDLVALYGNGVPVTELMEMFGVSRATVFRVLRRARAEVA